MQLQTQEELGRLLKEQMASHDAQRALQVIAYGITTLRTACNSSQALYVVHPFSFVLPKELHVMLRYRLMPQRST